MHEGALEEEARTLGPWFHNLHLPDGTQTAPDHPLGDFPHQNWLAFATRIPRDLSGRRVLDIGCNAGYYSFQLARRGAEVVGIDLDERYLRQARWAAEIYGVEDRVTFERRQVYDLSAEEERYDVVLFLGVFYHLRYPLLGLDIVREVCEDLLVFQSLESPSRAASPETYGLSLADLETLDAEGWPRMSFLEHPLQDDPTNWWVPNRPAVHALLRSAGFDIVNEEGAPFMVCRKSETTPPQLGWDRSEFLSARGRDWRSHVDAKLTPRAGTLETPRPA